ncbi:MAG: UDP-N-acetylmuramoyl-tripeptide--D-alanyl-D-alanine ligase [Alistipes sp.]|nr:UDP-N-acetylmuramoyl-tripeptide--D-alanyl-D-alanine ligase [Alistipes sp.]
MTDIEQLYDFFDECTGVTTDSRNVGEGMLFVALRGASFDGNKFVCAALDAGAKYAVADSDVPATERPDLAERILRVEDSLVALQELAREHRRRLALPIIGIVGSNGKTTTKELVSRVLAEKFEIYATRGNLNNHIGVPLTLLAMTRDTEFGVVEMGASACGEIALLASIAEPNFGIITNIGRAHLEGFGGEEGVRRGKGELFDFLAENGGHAFVPDEDAVLMMMAAERENLAVEHYSRAIADGVPSNLEGEYNRANIAAAIAIGRYFDIPQERIADAIANYRPDNNRSQRMQSGQNTLIVDCYNANPSSMAAAIENMRSEESDGKLLILGDMLELGEWSDEEHRRTLEAALSIDNAEIFTVGPRFEKAARDLVAQVKCFADTESLGGYLQINKLRGRTILLKGSRGIALEKIIEKL